MSGPFSLRAALNGLTPKQKGDTLSEQDVIAIIDSAEYGKSKQKQTDQWSFVATLVSGEELPDGWEGETLDGTIYWTTKSVTMAMRAFNALGITSERIDRENPDPDTIATWMEGVQFRGRVTVDEYRGVKRNRIEPVEFLGHGQSAAEATPGLDEFTTQGTSNPVNPPAVSKQEAPNGTAGAAVTDLAGDSGKAEDADDLWASAQ